MTTSQLNWFKSSYSGGSGTECVECAVVAGDVLIHDSKRDDGPVIGVRADAWRAFVRDALKKRSPLH